MAQDVHQSSFSAGMDQDISKTKLPANKYYKAENFRITTDKGLSAFDLENIKGNINLASFIDLPAVQKLTIDSTIPGTVTISISNGTYTDVGTTPFTVNSTTTPEDLWNYIQSDAGYVSLGTDYNVYFNSLFVLVVPIIAGTFTITLGSSSLILDPTYIPAQNNIEVIGSTAINDTIYLLTTNNTTQSPGDIDPVSYGQIWKLEVIKTSLIPSTNLTLIYNNAVNFSTYNAIAPSAIEGRYENSSIQRIVWTDNYNKLRSLNVADPQAFAIDVSLLDVVPAIDMDRPVMTDIGNSVSNIKLGVYQAAYRFKNTGGATTNFSELSDLVYITPTIDEHAAIGGAYFKSYVGGGVGLNVGKQITWTISNLDPEFERIEVVVLLRETLDSVPTILLLDDEPINGASSYTVTYDGSKNTTDMSLNEYLLLSSSFTHCKTIATKDNRLIAGNIRNETTIIDYDARAFRAFTSGADDIILTNDGLTATYTSATAQALDETEDTINDYTNPTLACFYKPGTSILGGAGINISYEFYTQAISADIDATATNRFNIPDFVYSPWRHTNPDYNQIKLDLGVKSFSDDFTQVNQTIPTAFPNNINAGFKFPPYNSALRGFQRGEIYRFGIQFFDKSKNPTFAKWIGDIKMPDFFDTNPNAFFSNGDPAVDVAGNPITDFRLSFTGSHVPGSAYNEAYVQSLGVYFTVNIPPDLSTQIDGYSIVRVKREETDKTIVSQGYITFAETGSDGNIYTTSPSVDPSGNTAGGTQIGDRGFFVTPDIIDSSLTVPAVSMNMKVKTILSNVNTDATILVSGGGDPYYMYKYYNNLQPNISAGTYTFNQIDFMGYAGNISDNTTSVNVYNYDWDFSAGVSSQGYSIGNAAYYFKTSVAINYSDLAALATAGKLLVNIERTVIDQYGGNDYTSRANNEYISCSHYRPIRGSNSTITDTFALYGGDIYVNMYDSCRWAKNWGSTGRGTASNKYSTTFFYPVESVANADLRSGTYMNKDFDSTTDTGIEMRETYTYNPIYNAVCDIKKFFPLPDPYIPNEEFNNRFYISEIKINGELTDAWGIFKPLNYWDVEGSFGPINACGVLQDQLYFAQDKAFGKLLINPRTAITSTNGEEIQIGRGNVIDSHNYISVENGTKHQFSWLKSGYQIFFVDIRHKKIFSFSQNRPLNPISDIKGMSSWLRLNAKGYLEVTDKPVYNDINSGINGIHGVFDHLNGELIYTFEQFQGTRLNPTQNLNTLVYSEKLDTFTGFYSHTPKIYINNNADFFSPSPSIPSRLWLHNFGSYGQFYGNYYDSTITLYANKYSEVTKVFNNIEFQTEVQDGFLVDTASGLTPIQETFNSLETSTDFQSNTIALVVDDTVKRRFRTWRCQVPKNSVQAAYVSTGLYARMRDKYLKVKFGFTNNSNKRFILHSILTYFNVNAPR